MPIQALLAAFLAFIAAAFTVLVPWDPAVALDPNPSATLAQWCLYWLILIVLGIGLGRPLEGPLLRLLPFVPAALLLLVTVSGQPSGVIELGRMRLPLPGALRALIAVVVSGGAWYGGVLVSSRALRYLEERSGR